MSPETPPSSPRMACSGKASRMTLRMASSEAESVSVTRSVAPLKVIVRGLSRAARTTFWGEEEEREEEEG